MWIKINGKPLQTSSIKIISSVEKITDDIIIDYYNRNLSRYYNSSNYNRDEKINIVYKYVNDNNKSTGNVINYLKKEDGSDDYDHIIKPTFIMDSDKFIFTVGVEEVTFSEGKSHVFVSNIHSKVFENFEDAEEVHNKLLTKLNEIEMSMINIEI